MIEFVAILVSADGGRVMRRVVNAPDIDSAVSQAVYVTESGELGARAAWFVGAVVQADYVYQVFAALEGMVA